MIWKHFVAANKYFKSSPYVEYRKKNQRHFVYFIICTSRKEKKIRKVNHSFILNVSFCSDIFPYNTVVVLVLLKQKQKRVIPKECSIIKSSSWYHSILLATNTMRKKDVMMTINFDWRTDKPGGGATLFPRGNYQRH